MSTFEQKIYSLTQKLQNMPSRPTPPKAPSQPQLVQLLHGIQISMEQKQQQYTRRYQCLMESLVLYQQQLNKILGKCEENLDRAKEDNSVHLENCRKIVTEKEEDMERFGKKVLCQAEEEIEEERCKFDLQLKKITKQTQRQQALLQKQLQNISNNPQTAYLSEDNKSYKQYCQKILQIQQNERKKGEKLNQIEKKVEKRIQKIFTNMIDRIDAQENSIKNKYQKMKRLFALITDLS